MWAWLSAVLAPGLLASEPVRTAAVLGGVAGMVCGAVGVLTVMRGQSFAGHALADVGSAGGAAAVLSGLPPLLGFFVAGLAASAGLELVRAGQPRERDLATGILTGAGLGIAALLLFLNSTRHASGGAAATVLFGSIFAVPAGTVGPALALGAAALLLLGVLWRPLLLSTLDADLAAARGIDPRLVGMLHLAAVALAVALSATTVGAILSTALLVGPAAIALRLAGRPGLAVLLAAAIGVAATWGGIVVAYDSYGWSGGRGWPASFCITAIVSAAYAAVAGAGRLRLRAQARG